MRGSGWIPFLAGALMMIAAAGYPLVATICLLFEGRADDSVISFPFLLLLVAHTAAWAGAITLGAILIGWLPGRALGRMRAGRWFVPLAALCVLPMCLPEYVIYWGWWQAWPANSPLYTWAVKQDHVDTLRGATLALGLVAWAWPIAAWSLAGADESRQQNDLLALDTRSRRRRLIAAVRQRARALAAASLIIFIFIFNNTTCFDLAQVKTLGYELRAMQSEGASSREMLAAALPGIAIAVLCGAAALLLLRRRSDEQPEDRPSGARTPALVIIATSAITLLPLALIWKMPIDGAAFEVVKVGYGRALGNTALASAIAGAGAAVATIGFAFAFADRRRLVRRTAGAMACAWALSSLVPAAVTAAALEAAYNTPFPANFTATANPALRFDEGIYRGPMIVILGYLARFGLVPALLAWWLARAEEKPLRAMRELDGAQTLAGLWAAWRPRWIAAAIATMAIVTTLSMGEVSTTAMLQPPRFEAISSILLNNMHYQRDDLVGLMARLIMALAVAAAAMGALLALALRRRRPAARAASVLLLIAMSSLLIPGCGDDPADEQPGALSPILIFGEPGTSIGQFNYPRAMDVDPQRGHVYIIDRSGRVQRFGLDGQPQKQWLLPKYDNGYPTGVTVAPDGHMYVADTHAHRVSVFDPDGNLVRQFGEPGEGPGQFTYPSDVAFGPGGRIYVSEFGGRDRVQVFDQSGTYLFEFGGFGSDEGTFNRPQSLSFNPAGTELFVADACNHRIQVFDPEGNLLRIIGSVGTEPGKFRYPYGVVALENGRLLVTEFGNHRLQVLSPDGEPLASLGAAGEAPGELTAPWTTAVTDDAWFILDSRNNRVQVIEPQD